MWRSETMIQNLMFKMCKHNLIFHKIQNEVAVSKQLSFPVSISTHLSVLLL